MNSYVYHEEGRTNIFSDLNTALRYFNKSSALLLFARKDEGSNFVHELFICKN